MMFKRSILARTLRSRTLAVLLAASVLPQPLLAAPQAEPERQALPLEELRLFSEVFTRIKNSYVEPVSDAQLLEDAIRGMMAGLDPHSAYLDPESFEALQEHTSGEFGGLGIEIEMKDGFVRVITPIDDTPAQRAGVKAGDLIVKLDDTQVQGLSLNEAVELMRGKPGEPITLTIMREGRDQPLEITLKRDEIHVASVKQRMLSPGYGYLRITQFQINTGADLLKAIGKLKAQGEMKGLVLDLRNNPGGVLQAAVAVADAFLDEGVIVSTKGRVANADMSYSATAQTALPDLPVIVLVNGGSASASEIVAGALQDHGRATIMGVDSFGKGSVQTIQPLLEGRAVKLTTARYYTPGGRSIQAQGIVPDIRVEEAELRRREQPEHIKERDLSGHLENGQAEMMAMHPDSDLASQDYQLYEALNLLKALNIASKVK